MEERMKAEELMVVARNTKQEIRYTTSMICGRGSVPITAAMAASCPCVSRMPARSAMPVFWIYNA